MLQEQWIAGYRAQWAAHRAAASVATGDGGPWLDGDKARAIACDAMIIPVVTGDVDPGAVEELISLCVRYHRLRTQRPATGPDADVPAGLTGRAARQAHLAATVTEALAEMEHQILGKILQVLSGPGGSPLSCTASCSASPWPGPPSRWTSARPTRSRSTCAAWWPCVTRNASTPADTSSKHTNRRARCRLGLHSADSKPTALQTALEHVLTCIGAARPPGFGTYSAQNSQPGMRVMSSIAPAERLPPHNLLPSTCRSWTPALEDPLLAKYVHVVGYRRCLGLNLLSVCRRRSVSGLVVVRCSGQLDRDRLLRRSFHVWAQLLLSWSALVSLSSSHRPMLLVTASFWHVAGTGPSGCKSSARSCSGGIGAAQSVCR